MKNQLREAWTAIIRPEDYEKHMAAVGQAQANAKLVEEYFLSAYFETTDTILFVGAGTGQMFDYASPSFLLPFETTFADINAGYLKLLSARLKRLEGLRFETVVDDIEQTQLKGNYSAIVAVLVLEHVDWRKAVAAMCALASKNILIVIQENPSSFSTALTPKCAVVGTMNVFAEVHPTLLPRIDVEAEFLAHGFRKNYGKEENVLDGKKMLALGFEKIGVEKI